MTKYRNLTTAAVISVIFFLLYNISSFAFQCSDIRGDVIRLHVVANSDSNEDQELKLKVRDAVLSGCEELFNGTVTVDNAEERLNARLDDIKAIAEKTIEDNGSDYGVNVRLCTEYFDTRTYNDSVTLPAGKYLALKIVLGDGKGQNWWCVMFPALCLPAVEETNEEALEAVFSDKEEKIVTDGKKYEVRFKIVEYIEKLKNRVDN